MKPTAEQETDMQTPTQRTDGASAIAALIPDHVVELDVRPELRAGREPFSLIMDAVRRVPPGGALMLRTIFEPAPLYDVMKRRGFTHWTECRSPDDWVVWFFTEQPADSGSAALRDAPLDDLPEDAVVLDVRGLEPPEPMVRTLAALETLPAGATLVQINARVPQFLIPMLEERGFQYEVREQNPDLVRLFIRRTGA
jgi:uncharacterized protein (DUF2249 family)